MEICGKVKNNTMSWKIDISKPLLLTCDSGSPDRHSTCFVVPLTSDFSSGDLSSPSCTYPCQQGGKPAFSTNNPMIVVIFIMV